jgi:hypothetical protein
MKKKSFILITALSLLMATTACTEEEMTTRNEGTLPTRTFTCRLDDGDLTKTSLTDKGKTVWNQGDKIWVSDGTAIDTLTVTPHTDAPQYCDFETALQGTLYVVYPLSAAKGISDGKFKIDVPSVQSGTFADANISVAVATDRYVKMHNITSVLAFRVPSTAEKVKTISIEAKGNPLSGGCTVDMTSGTPVVTPENTSSSVTIKTDALTGRFYASVLPGTYDAGFSLSAVSSDFAHATQTRSTLSQKTMRPNDLFDLGVIGDDLQPIGGDGTSSSPWLISSLPEMIAFTNKVNEGDPFRGRFVKVTKDIDNIATIIGTYDEKNKKDIPFQGDFDGDGKTLTLAISQRGTESTGLFAFLSDSAYVHDVKVKGTITSTYDYVGSIAGRIEANNTGIRIENCTSSVKTSGRNAVGGIVGYLYGLNDGKVYIESTISGCTNEGDVTGERSEGGIVGYAYVASLQKNSNSGKVTSTADNGGDYLAYTEKKNNKTSFLGTLGTNYENGTGGIVGWSKNVTIFECTNSANVTAVNKTGGIVGSAYFGTINKCTNSGTVTISKNIAGGIAGWLFTYAMCVNCTNNGAVNGDGTSIAGIAGYVCPNSNSKYPIYVIRCINKGAVHSLSDKTGGIVGASHSIYNANNNITIVKECDNEGTVTSEGTYVGGIMGYTKDLYSYTSGSIDGSLNSGDVKGSHEVGGILGYFDRSNAGARQVIQSCENTGTITSTVKGTGSSDDIGGIIGASPLSVNDGRGVLIYNCNNKGNIRYEDPTHTNPYAGGIAGRLSGCQVWNCDNTGSVGPTNGTEAEGASSYMGALVGKIDSKYLTFSYFLSSSYPSAIGKLSTSTALTTTPLTVLSYDADGNLASPVTVKEIPYAKVLEALSAPIDNNDGYYKWTNGPTLCKPTYSDPVNGDDFGIGNDGKL